MLEKIGLPAKPSLRGNNWVVDATHCQGCSSQFTFINRKHHCRRCGGLFCGSCTQQRMVLRGQGDSAVRICEACKKLEDAARFEMRYGHKNKAARGSSRSTSVHDDGLLKQILDNHATESSSSGQSSVMDLGSSFKSPSSTASSANPQKVNSLDREGQTYGIPSVDEPDPQLSQIGLISPEKLRQLALDERRIYKVLKGEGKSEDALKAFKRAKDLERQADALDLSIRKNRRKVLTSGGTVEIQKKDGVKSGRKSQQQDDLTAELRQLGWSEMDMHDVDKRSANISLEGELSSLFRDVPGRTNKDTGTSSIDKTQVVAHKRKALTLKREGNLAEAKEELKKAKALEKKLEEQELLSVAEDSDDEISALIHSMDNDKEDKLLVGYEQEYGFDFDHLTGIADDLGVNDSFEVTDEDMVDPEIAATLNSLGWADDSNNPENIEARSTHIDKEALRSEILSIKKEALNQKHAGNLAEAMAHLRKAKLLERDLESSEGQDSLTSHDHTIIQKGSTSQNVKEKSDVGPNIAPKNRLKIQKELLALKRKALSLRREGKFDEADEELKRGKVLEHQLEELDNASKVKETQATVYSEDKDLADEHSVSLESPAVGEQDGEDVTDQDMSDPAYLAVLRNLGWKDEDNEPTDSQFKPPKEKNIDDHSMKTSSLSVTESKSNTSTRTPRRSYAEVQRELLNLKRKALTLRRKGNINEAEEVLLSAKTLEAEMAELEAPSKGIQAEVNSPNDDIARPLHSATEEGYVVDVKEEDMHDQAHLSMLKNLGWSDEGQEALTREGKPSKQISAGSVHSIDPSPSPTSSSVSVARPRSKGEMLQELLGIKRKALAHKRKGEAEQAEELLKMAKVLEAQMEEAKQKMGTLPTESLMKHEEPDDVKDAAVLKGSIEINDDSLLGLRGKESAVVAPSTRFPAASQQLMENNYHLTGELSPQRESRFTGNAGMSHATGSAPSQHLMNLADMLTEGPPTSFRIEDEETKFKSDTQISKGVKTNKRDGEVNVDSKQHAFVTSSAQEVGSTNNKNSLRQEVLIHKRKALALKKDGKLIEAREELRQAKLLEKSLEEDTFELGTGTHDQSANVPIALPAQDQASAAPSVAPKLLSGRDRFKLQQESLSLKREALKLRRENRMEEAEAKFEKAKAIEAQLEESSSQDSKKSSVNVAEPEDDEMVEDLLDPQLLSALKAIGIGDANSLPQPTERPQPVKVIPAKSVDISHERIELEERIKAEKVKAVSLKRSGKQAEALDALRRAKMFEKKLNALT